MVGEYLRIISEIRPDGFLLENVESILHPTNRPVVDFIENEIINGIPFQAYSCKCRRIWHSSKRKRVIYLASRNIIEGEPDKLSKEESSRVNVLDWIGRFDTADLIEDEEFTTGKTYDYELSEVPPGHNYIALSARDGYPNPKFVIAYLTNVNAILEGTPFKLGYRTANEALIYLRTAQEFGQADRVAALDNFTLMKILSRIEGDENKLKITDSEADKERLNKSHVDCERAKSHGDLNVLTALREIIVQQLGEYYNIEEEVTLEEGDEQNDKMAEGEQVGEAALQVPREEHGEKLKSIKKIDNMLSQLKRDHFVSYWN